VAVEVAGAAFLKYMVRSIVGTLVEVGRGHREPDSIPGLLASRDRAQAGPTARPHGLHLCYVQYPQHPWAEGAALTSGPAGVLGVARP
jgi:tRNA pseudouridine38-40 synthase